jgi:hypothetical protein
MNSVHQLDDIFSILFPLAIVLCIVAWITALVAIAKQIRKAEKGEKFLGNNAEARAIPTRPLKTRQPPDRSPEHKR